MMYRRQKKGRVSFQPQALALQHRFFEDRWVRKKKEMKHGAKVNELLTDAKVQSDAREFEKKGGRASH